MAQTFHPQPSIGSTKQLREPSIEQQIFQKNKKGRQVVALLIPSNGTLSLIEIQPASKPFPHYLASDERNVDAYFDQLKYASQKRPQPSVVNRQGPSVI